MRTDAFSQCHPAVNFLYFVGAIGFGVAIWHPAYLLAGVVGALAYYLLLKGSKGVKTLLMLLPLCALMAGINPLFNHQGERILFRFLGNPYTLEALLYGCAVAAVFLVMMLWFGCYSVVMTGDKFTSLFGNLIPALSLLLVMVFRMVPGLVRKAGQITHSRRSIGKGVTDAATYREKAADGMAVLACLTSWALEGGIITADSMRSRGYGAARRTSFAVYHMTIRDWVVLAAASLLAVAVVVISALGSTAVTYTPVLDTAPVSGVYAAGLAAYCVYLLIPTALHIKEAMQWHILESRI